MLLLHGSSPAWSSANRITMLQKSRPNFMCIKEETDANQKYYFDKISCVCVCVCACRPKPTAMCHPNKIPGVLTHARPHTRSLPQKNYNIAFTYLSVCHSKMAPKTARILIQTSSADGQQFFPENQTSAQKTLSGSLLRVILNGNNCNASHQPKIVTRHINPKS